ncbi:MAG: hypothetical protein AAFQ11_02755, partial [Pseudomonadota bacterium]
LVWWLGKSLEAFQVLPIYKTLAMELTRTVGGYAKAQQTMAVCHLVDVTRACEAAVAAAAELCVGRAHTRCHTGPGRH